MGTNKPISIRMRIATSDAHYAGNLVDGAKMLQLFGDVATELLIRLDGDEGLFRAYEEIDFVAPVYAGDFIEATGEIIEVGNTSRKIKFEARKYIQPVSAERGGVAVSSAEVLDPPLVVCRAIGTCVTPKNLQRKL